METPEIKHEFYVSTTMGTTWYGRIDQMRDDYKYYNVDTFLTEEEAINESSRRKEAEND
jgi:hypothetical protein